MGSSTFVKVYDDLEDHPNWQAIDSLAEAVGLWTLAFIYCGRNKTDGHFPERMVTRRWAGTEASKQALLDAGRWHLPGHACVDCPQPESGQLYMHAYLERNRSRAQIEALSEKRAEAGRAGGNARVAKHGAKQVAKPDSSRSNPDNREQIQNKDTAAAIAAEFDIWWSHYPNKRGKAAAAKAYAKARKTASNHDLARGLVSANAEWTAARTDPKFIPHPATWLNQGRWADEVPTIPGTPSAPPITLRQCDNTAPHPRHRWEDARNSYGCQGETA